MIGRLRGRLVERSPDRLLVDVAGVGYDVRIPLSTYYALNGSGQAQVDLHVHTHVREDALELFGFACRDERALFLLLIGIAGVGPRMALAILSGIGASELRETVWRQDRSRLEKIPGVGKKTAERLLLELRDKLGGEGAPAGPADAGDAAAAATPDDSPRSDAVSALVNLGYSRSVARRAVERIAEQAPDLRLEDLLKRALAGLVQ